MPYTPPSHRSPATSSPSSPVLSRNQSYDAHLDNTDRPGLPRSRSQTYLQKHRRSPSLLETQSTNATHTSTNGHLSASHHHINGVSHQDFSEPKAFAHFVLPTDGSTASPSESQGSEEEDEIARGRKLVDLASTLRETVPTRRGRSPDRTEEDRTPAAPRATPSIATDAMSSPGLTPEARKISHSRSTSEIHLPKYAADNEDVSPIHGSSESEAEDDGLRIKPPLLRKKSGELVKPALRPGGNRRRPSSMPGTPTYSKAVHFNEDIEQVRHFLQVDRPIAVSAGTSPATETYDSETEYPFGGTSSKSKGVEWDIRTANFPAESMARQTQAVRVEKIFLSSDNTLLVGTVAVANISFHKSVVARFTLDYWKTTSEVGAEYNNDPKIKEVQDGFDRFNFNIRLADLAHLDTKTMLICVRYSVDGQEFWDNNNSMNYQIDFIKKVPVKSPRRSVTMQGAISSSQAPSLPRSRQSPLTRPKSFPAPGSDDDFSRDFPFARKESFGSGDDQPVIRLKSHPRKSSLFPAQARRTQSGGPAFSTRYDFSASLTAALNNAQTALGEQSGLKVRQPPTKVAPAATKAASAAPAVQPVEGSRPEKLLSDRPELHSQEYNDLIQRFCYFGSGGKSSPAPGLASPINENGPASKSKTSAINGLAALNTDVVVVADSNSSSPNGSPRSSATNSPPSPRPQFDGASDSPALRSTTPPFHPISPWLAPARSPSPGLLSAYQDFPFQGLSAQPAQC